MEFYLLAPGIVGGDRAQARATAARIARIDAAAGFMAQARLHPGNAEMLLTQAVASQPGNYRARIALANQYITPERHSYELAEMQARQALRIDHTRVDAYAILAASEAGRGNWTELDVVLTSPEKEVRDDLTPDYSGGGGDGGVASRVGTGRAAAAQIYGGATGGQRAYGGRHAAAVTRDAEPLGDRRGRRAARAEGWRRVRPKSAAARRR